MVEAGLEKEAKKLYPHKNLSATKSLGYQEWFDHFDGKFTKEEAILEIQKNTILFVLLLCYTQTTTD